MKVKDPVFVVYGNRGFRTIMANFLCNMALFPPMQSHILAVVTDEETGEFIRSFGQDINVFVNHQNLHESYDFDSRGYLDLMISRGLFLVDLLAEAYVQSKTLIWLEPDFYYTQNLLNRPEMIDNSSDMVFFWDHEMYCGCFIRFAPVPASLVFYKEVMDRMQKIHAVNGTTNDQILLNAVVADQLPDFSVFDRCLYRSGTYNTGGFMLEYQRSCEGIRPVAQHHNWIIGAESKVEMAKLNGGWFLTDDGDRCKTRDMLVVVMTMNRAWSLKRLINSIDSAVYHPGSTVDLRFSVDRDNSNNVDVDTMVLLNSLDWSRGLLEVNVWPKKAGIYGQWVNSWPAELYPDDLYKAVVLLEDDLEVSPYYAQWFVGAHGVYGDVSGVGAITGQRPNLVAAVNGPNSVAEQVPAGVAAFGYMLIATWSLSPKPSVWREFRQWVADKREKSPGFLPLVPGIVPTQWYEHFKTIGEEEGMWEMWFIRFMDERKLYTVYPWVEGGSKTIVGNWMESGLHFSGTPVLDFPILKQAWDIRLLMQNPLPLVGYGLNFSGFNPGTAHRTKRSCTELEAESMAMQEPISNSNCPDQRVWMNKWLEETSYLRSNAIIVSIGCNRGDDLVTSMRKWTRNDSYRLDRLESYYAAHFPLPRACPVLSDMGPSAVDPLPASGYCVEAMVSTFLVVDRMVKEQGWDSQIHVINAVASSVSGSVRFPAAVTGKESLGVGDVTETMDIVRMITVDELVQDQALVRIDVLSIDTEGNDANVIMGAIKSLLIVNMLEFEYHRVNAWAESDLRSIIDLLDRSGFDCFWQGNQGQLWWLTGCWHDSYYSKRDWSNIACARRDEHALHSIMVKLAYPVL